MKKFAWKNLCLLWVRYLDHPPKPLIQIIHSLFVFHFEKIDSCRPNQRVITKNVQSSCTETCPPDKHLQRITAVNDYKVTHHHQKVYGFLLFKFMLGLKLFVDFVLEKENNFVVFQKYGFLVHFYWSVLLPLVGIFFLF